MIFLFLLFVISTEGAEEKDIELYELSAPGVLSTLPILSPTPDTILYDCDTALYFDPTPNTWTGVRFTPLTNFELQAIYFGILNQYNNTTDGCSLYVVADDGLGEPDWPAGILDSFWVAPPVPDRVWIQVDLSSSIRFAAYQDFHVIYGPAPGGPYPGPGWWNLFDSDSTTTQRSYVSHDNRQTWITIINADAFIRAGGEYDSIFTILDVYASLPSTIGDTIEVVGWYVTAEDSLLIVNLELLNLKLQPSPHSYIFLEGILPPSQYDSLYVKLMGVVDTIHYDYPVLGVTAGAVLEVISYGVVQGYERGNSPYQNPRKRDFNKAIPRDETVWGELNECDDCNFGLLISGHDPRPPMQAGFNRDVDRDRAYLIAQGYKPECIKELRNASRDQVRQAFDWLKEKIEACELQCKPTTLSKFYSGHGGGYHSGNPPTWPPYNLPHGLRGVGAVDEDGDEGDADKIAESDLVYRPLPGEGPANGTVFGGGWDIWGNDGVGDFRPCRAPTGRLAIDVRDRNTGNWRLAGWDKDFDGDIDADDGGIDLNGDGDTDDSWGFDETMSLRGGAMTDDEWASRQKALVDACLDSLLEKLDACFSGGFKKDEEDKLPCKVAVIKVMAAAQGEFAGGDGDGGTFEIPFIKALTENPPGADQNGDGKVDWQEAFEWAKKQDEVKNKQTPQIWVKEMCPEAKLLLIGKELKSQKEMKYAYFDSLERKLDSLLSQPYQGLPPEMDSLRDCANAYFDSVKWVHEHSPLPESLKLEKKAKLISHGLICEKHLKKKGFEELERKIDSLRHQPYGGLPPDVIAAFDSADVYYDSVEVVHEDPDLPETEKLEKKLLYIARGLLKQLNAKMKSFEALEIKLDSLLEVPYTGMPAEMVDYYNSASQKFDSVSTVHADPELEEWDKIQLKLELIRESLNLERLIYEIGFAELDGKLRSTVCCQFPYYCDMIPWGSCVAQGGTPYVSSQYECIGGSCQIPFDPCDTIGYARPCTPNDPGICDTLYKEIFPGDEVFYHPGPHFVRIPLYVTHDVPNPSIDSIASFVIPLCYTHSNPSKYCSLSAYWNNTDLYPYPTTDRSIFRHLVSGNDTTHNWMMGLSEQGMGEEWNTRVLELDGTSYFRMALVPTGSQDQRFGPGSRVLLATMTFKLEDTTTIYFDSCFWPPSDRLAFTRSDMVIYIPSHFFPQCEKITSIGMVNCGDCTGDGITDIGDVVYLINYLFRQPWPPPQPYMCVGDVNNDDVVDISDVVYLINWLFRQPWPPPDPDCCNPPWASE